jgi:hypothetical protein
MLEKATEKYDPYSDKDIVISFPESAFYEKDGFSEIGFSEIGFSESAAQARSEKSRDSSKDKITSRDGMQRITKHLQLLRIDIILKFVLIHC